MVKHTGTDMNWLREAINDSTTGKASSKRIAMLSGAVSMSLAVVVLSAASLFGYDVAAALWAVTVPLAGLGGYSYVNGKIAERAAP